MELILPLLLTYRQDLSNGKLWINTLSSALFSKETVTYCKQTGCHPEPFACHAESFVCHSEPFDGVAGWHRVNLIFMGSRYCPWATFKIMMGSSRTALTNPLLTYRKVRTVPELTHKCFNRSSGAVMTSDKCIDCSSIESHGCGRLWLEVLNLRLTLHLSFFKEICAKDENHIICIRSISLFPSSVLFG